MQTASNALATGKPRRLASPRADSIASRYSDVAANPEVNEKIREAAMLLSIAEGHLDDEEDPNCEEALKAANQALEIFKEASSPSGIAEALRCVVQATVMQGDRGEADRLAREGMADAKAKGDKRGEAILLMSLAELVSLDKKNRITSAELASLNQAAEEGCHAAGEAANHFHNLGDSRDVRMETCAYIMVAKLRLIQRNPKEALDAANKAVHVAEEAHDMVMAAKAAHVLGEAHVMSEEVGHVKNGIKNGIQAFKNSLAIYENLGMTIMIGYGLHDLAHWTMKCLYKPKTVNSMALRAVQIFKDANKPKAVMTCMELVVKAQLRYRDHEAANKDAFNNVLYFRKQADSEKLIARAWILLTEVHLEEGRADTACEAISNAVTIASELGDKALLAQVLMKKGLAESGCKLFSDAQETLEEARNIAKEAENYEEEALVFGCLCDVALAAGEIEAACAHGEAQKQIYAALEKWPKFAASILTIAACIADKSSQWATTDKGRLGMALGVAKEARKVGKDAKAPRVEAGACLLIAKCSMLLEQEDDAVEASESMLSILKHVAQSDEAMGRACLQLAKAYMELGVAEQALKNADKATAFAKRSEDPAFEAETMITVAEVYYGVALRQEQDTRAGQHEFHKCATRAWQLAKLATARCQRFKYKELLAKSLCAMGEVGVYFDADLAFASASQAVDISAEAQDDIGVATAVLLQANIMYHKGQNRPASELARKGKELAEAAGLPDLIADAEDLIARTAGAGPQMGGDEAIADGAPVAVAAASIAVSENTGLDPAMVTEVVSRVAMQSVSADEDLEMDTPLMEAGLDSLASVAFRNQLMNEMKMQMPAALMFDYPNIRQLTDFIVEKSKE